jgi:hypothetical protein
MNVSGFGGFGCAAIILVILALLCIGPLLAIWASNALLDLSGSELAIPYCFKSLFAMFLLLVLFGGPAGWSNKK